MSRWPLRYRVAHRAHCLVSDIHHLTGRHGATQWLNDRLGALWIPWWLKEGRKS